MPSIDAETQAHDTAAESISPTEPLKPSPAISLSHLSVWSPSLSVRQGEQINEMYTQGKVETVPDVIT